MNRKILLFILCMILNCTLNAVFCAENPAGDGLIKDDIVDNILKERNIEKPYIHAKYDYKSTVKIPVKISLKEKIKSENDVYIGQNILFEAEYDVYYKRKLKIKKGETIKAKVGTIITSGMNGIPASVIFESFEIPDIKKGQISDTLEIFGQDRSLIVFPLKWALTILPPTGTLTNFIMGGHVRAKAGKTFTIYYYPEWL